jgi:glycosyltransferase involved in cell wall biosynthesis
MRDSPREPRVALLVACHDDAPTIRETIDSLLAEPDTELVVVDDGSTDAPTREILARLEQQGVRVLYQENSGPSAAWMHGLSATTAPYVMPFSSDDLLIGGALKALADALDGEPQAGFAWGDMETFGLAEAYVPSVPELCPWLVTYTNRIPPYSLFRRSVLVDVGGWAVIASSEDWDLWMRLAARGQTGIYVPGPVFRYRRGASNRSGRFRRGGTGYGPFYEELRVRNASLFAARPANRQSSPAPRSLKLLVPALDALPGIPRLEKIRLSGALTFLFWSARFRRTVRIVAQEVVFRRRVGSAR